MTEYTKGDADQWRKLALQFDANRMQAMQLLKACAEDPEMAKDAVEKFLSSPPVSGDEVLRNLTAEAEARGYRLGQEDEREACAKLVETVLALSLRKELQAKLAAAIRARGGDDG